MVTPSHGSSCSKNEFLLFVSHPVHGVFVTWTSWTEIAAMESLDSFEMKGQGFSHQIESDSCLAYRDLEPKHGMSEFVSDASDTRCSQLKGETCVSPALSPD
jgi:hypothetical protein